jgi:hypothetical protein
MKYVYRHWQKYEFPSLLWVLCTPQNALIKSISRAVNRVPTILSYWAGDEIPAYYAVRRFMAQLIKSRNCILYWDRRVHFTTSHPNISRLILYCPPRYVWLNELSSNAPTIEMHEGNYKYMSNVTWKPHEKDNSWYFAIDWRITLILVSKISSPALDYINKYRIEIFLRYSLTQ